MFDLSLHILDIAQNSLQHGADNISVDCIIEKDEQQLYVVIKDNGSGMDNNIIESAICTNYSSSMVKGRGKGLPKLNNAAARTGGFLKVSSKLNYGTTVTAMFKLDSLNMLPVGDISSTITTLILANRKIRFLFNFKGYGKKATVDTHYVNNQLLNNKKHYDVEDIKQLEDYTSYQIESLLCNDYLI